MYVHVFALYVSVVVCECLALVGVILYRLIAMHVVDNWQIDLEHIHGRFTQSVATDCRTLQPRRPCQLRAEL